MCIYGGADMQVLLHTQSRLTGTSRKVHAEVVEDCTSGRGASRNPDVTSSESRDPYDTVFIE